jgi:hypothetical protein
MPLLAILFVGGIVALALAVELGRFAAVTREAAFAADVGAETGAAVIDRDAAYAGRLLIDRNAAADAARDAALRARPRRGRDVVVEAAPQRICVTVTQTVEAGLLGVFGVHGWAVAATGCAFPARG